MTDGFYGEGPVDLGLHELPQWTEFMHYLYLPVRIPLTDPDVRGDSGRLVGRTPTGPGAVFDLPERLSFLGVPIFAALADAQQHASHLDNPYVYVTARRGYASPGNPLNRPGWHTDDFGGTDLNYIWTDAFPTRFLLADEPLAIPADDQASMEKMAMWAALAEPGPLPDLRIVDGPVNHLLRLSPHVIHDTPLIPEPGGMRSFFKISISTRRYNLAGNSRAYGLDYDWPLVERQASRNQPAA